MGSREIEMCRVAESRTPCTGNWLERCLRRQPGIYRRSGGKANLEISTEAFVVGSWALIGLPRRASMRGNCRCEEDVK